MDCTVSNHLEWKCPTQFTILIIGHFDHSKWPKWPEMWLPNGAYDLQLKFWKFKIQTNISLKPLLGKF